MEETEHLLGPVFGTYKTVKSEDSRFVMDCRKGLLSATLTACVLTFKP